MLDARARGVTLFRGAIAQLGERLICIQEVVGSIPSGSTITLSDDKSSLIGVGMFPKSMTHALSGRDCGFCGKNDRHLAGQLFFNNSD